MAHIHARAKLHGRAWSADEFRDLLSDPLTFVSADENCFALGRAVAGEAELLLIATDPAHQRNGLARAQLLAFESCARNRNAELVFLEVAETNTPARALYDSAGFKAIGTRQNYYQTPDGNRVSAVVMSKSLIK